MFFLYSYIFFFFFNDTATTEIYTLSLHDALPIELRRHHRARCQRRRWLDHRCERSEEHTSELQSRLHLVCRLLLEKKKNIKKRSLTTIKKENFLLVGLTFAASVIVPMPALAAIPSG